VTGNYGEIFTITKVNSRSFYTERKEGTAKFSTSDGWDYISFQKEEDDVWMATASLGKIPQSEKQS
jgi:hypothetical protein